MTAFCRDCFANSGRSVRCKSCGSHRLLSHPELEALAIAHIDCDAFYAAVEKRDGPELADKPVIIGGGKRGVAMTACYVARIYGVKSAMPMFQALQLCPHAVVIKPRMSKYTEVAREVRALMREVTPLVEPLSLDEAYLDLSGTERLHGTTPAKTLARLARGIEQKVGITVSIGLSFNKFLAKLASDLDKPRGFAILGGSEAAALLAPKPVTLIFGVGKIAQQRLARDGFHTIGDLQRAGEMELKRRYGAEGVRLFRLARGLDDRCVTGEREAKSISAETTFDRDLGDFRSLELQLWRLCEKVSARLKANLVAGSTVTLKLKSADFRIRTRAQSLAHPTQLAVRIFGVGRELLVQESDGTMLRLIGIGVSSLAGADGADFSDLIDRRTAEAEQAIDRLRERFGDDAVIKGLALHPEVEDHDR